jgi:hypothetical protein
VKGRTPRSGWQRGNMERPRGIGYTQPVTVWHSEAGEASNGPLTGTRSTRVRAEQCWRLTTARPWSAGLQGGRGRRQQGNAAEGPVRPCEEPGGARREAATCFADDTLFMERLVLHSRRFESQVLADTRPCRAPRRAGLRFEGPAPDDRRGEIFGAGSQRNPSRDRCRGSGTCALGGGLGDGRLELVSGGSSRGSLGDEHAYPNRAPVTETVTGIDLVEDQLRVGAGEALGFVEATSGRTETPSRLR